MNKVTQGADLTHPRLSAWWIIGAVIAVIVLAFAVSVGLAGYKQASTVVPGLSAVNESARTYMS